MKHISQQLRRARHIPRYAKQKANKAISPAIPRARSVKNKAILAYVLLTDRNKRLYYFTQKKTQGYERNKQWTKAADSWQRIIELLDNDAPASAFAELSRSYRMAGDYNEAFKVVDEAVARYPRGKTGKHATDDDLRSWLTLSREKAEITFMQITDNFEDYKKQLHLYRSEQKKRSKQQLKIAVFSAVAGGYDIIKPPAQLDPRFDYILYTDNPVKSLDIVDVRPLPYYAVDNTRSARFVKTNPHRLLNDYDIAVWVDSNLLITGDIYPAIEKVLQSGKPFGAMRHAVRRSPHQEMESCIRQKRDDEATIREQMHFYEKEGYDTKEMIESSFLVYDLRDTRLEPFLNEWWNQIDRFSKRDQLSINYSLDKHSIKWQRLTERPNTARNHPALALTDHGMGSESLAKLIYALDMPTIQPNIGESFSKVKAARLRNQHVSITAVVCVHNALPYVKKCFNAVKKYKHSALDLIIVDDGSEADTENYLKSFQADNANWVRLIRHKKAHGYTKSASEGLKTSTADFTILLNSDTIVTPDWAQKMADVALTNKGVGIVGPLSSAASHQSVPDHKSKGGQTAVNELPKGFSVNDMNDYCEKWSFTNNIPRVPLVHGFCFGVTKEVIDSIGYLDAASFPRGYGEENDYCFRAADAGFGMALATHTYIYHAKSKSFISNERQKLMDDGMSALKRKHGQRRIDHAVKSMQQNAVLVALREKFNQLYNQMLT